MSFPEFWEKSEQFHSLDRHLANFFVRPDASGQRTEAQKILAWTIACTSRALREGHSCLELGQLSPTEGWTSAEPEEGRLPSLVEWVQACLSFLEVESVQQDEVPEGRSSCAAGGAAWLRGKSPFVLDESGRFYFRRYYEYEQRIAGILLRLAGPSEGSEAIQPALLDHYFQKANEEDAQRRAAQRAVERPCAILSGGPGTGKTSTVVKILALLAQQALSQNRPAPEVLLLAPTGKAAARLMESIRKAKSELKAPPEVLAAITESASTIHRALGVLPDSRTRFRRNALRPLSADVVLVDEASMVDVALMSHLFEALRPDARLLLLGDRFQLASVEAGSAFAELCRAAELATAPTSSDARGASWPAFTELTKSYRFGENSAIFAFAQAVRAGDAERALQIARQGSKDFVFQENAEFPENSKIFRQTVLRGYDSFVRAREPEAAFRQMEKFRVLAAHRRGPFGVENLNEWIRSWLARKNRSSSQAEFYVGRPILVRQNDPTLELFNGDMGWVGRHERQLSVYFERAGRAPLRLSPAQLPQHDSAYAMTIHQTQGSEYDEVLLVLPEENSPLLTRELLYTAVTRAKKKVILLGSEQAIRVACQRPTQRWSGLAEALRREQEELAQRGLPG